MGNGERKLKILLVEDNPSDATWLEHMIDTSRAYPVQLLPATSIRSAIEILERDAPHCVLLDLSLPDSHGVDSVRRIVEVDAQTPVVVLTGTDDEMGLEAVRSGAQDFLVKGSVDGDEILRHVLWAVARASVMAARVDASRLDPVADGPVAALAAPAVTIDADLRVVDTNDAFDLLVPSLDPIDGKPLTDVVVVDAVFDVVSALRPIVTGAVSSTLLPFPLERSSGVVARTAVAVRLAAAGVDGGPVALVVVAEPQA